MPELILTSVKSRNVIRPPVNAKSGERYIISLPAIDEWKTHPFMIAEWNESNNQWDYTDPAAGSWAWIEDIGQLQCKGPGAWELPETEHTEVTFVKNTCHIVHNVILPHEVVIYLRASQTIFIHQDKSLTLDSSANIQAPIHHHIFAGLGSVTFTHGGTVFPEWWGVHCTPGYDDKPAFKAAIDSGANIVRILPRHYYFNTPLLISRYGIRLMLSFLLADNWLYGIQ